MLPPNCFSRQETAWRKGDALEPDSERAFRDLFCVSCSASAVLVRLSFRSVTSLCVVRQAAAGPQFAKARCQPSGQPGRPQSAFE